MCSPNIHIQSNLCTESFHIESTCTPNFLGGYFSTLQGLQDWFEVDLGFHERVFIQIDLCTESVHFGGKCAPTCAQTQTQTRVLTYTQTQTRVLTYTQTPTPTQTQTQTQVLTYTQTPTPTQTQTGSLSTRPAM